MKGILNLLAKAKLIDLSEEERLAASSELPRAALAAKVETLGRATESSGRRDLAECRAIAARASIAGGRLPGAG
jgi:hypothetical protein